MIGALALKDQHHLLIDVVGMFRPGPLARLHDRQTDPQFECTDLRPKAGNHDFELAAVTGRFQLGIGKVEYVLHLAPCKNAKPN